MNFLARILRFVFWVLILSWCLSLLRRLITWMLGGATMRASQPDPGPNVTGASEATGMARRLVRDPVCGVHVAEVMSIPLREGAETLHFCSIACRDEYVSRTQKKIAANA
jgi:hypothetical protein